MTGFSEGNPLGSHYGDSLCVCFCARGGGYQDAERVACGPCGVVLGDGGSGFVVIEREGWVFWGSEGDA